MMDLWSLIYSIVQVIIRIIFDTLKYFQDIRLSRRPICTTMPWTIRVALAVIWGVCWMFYYTPTDVLDLENELHLPSPSTPPTLPSVELP
jgi:membrane protease YdiL (CAAX protease family)